MNDASRGFDVAVVGGGPAGLAAAIALATAGARTALIARRQAYGDNRTTALLGGSVTFLEGLDVWRRCLDRAAALTAMRLVDDTGRLIRAPEVRFSAEEIGLDQFGYNIDNRTLVAALEARATELSGLTRRRRLRLMTAPSPSSPTPANRWMPDWWLARTDGNRCAARPSASRCGGA